ncbi:hypothetical protein BJ165DRAFT_1610580 [Panaeolus papilionaceus]|nr:hypothetical protein BJ165DRAFT_1610580 [Panaeolus papilionaceus]
MSTQQETSASPLQVKDLSILPIADNAFEYNSERGDVVTLLMGPTGAGKSSFIEAVAGHDALGISKDQLDSVTQMVTTYELTNIDMWNGPGTSIRRRREEEGRIYILDTPGFSDSQISELEIIEMVKGWMKGHNCSSIDNILYLLPITDTRLPGSKRRTIEMLKLLAAINTDKPGEIMVITTMWDRLWNERTMAAAEDRFVQLQDQVWKGLLDAGGNLTKFTNTHSSALECLNLADSLINVALPDTFMTQRFQDATFSPHLYRDLLDRIQATQQRKHNIEAELRDPVVRSNKELKAYTKERLHKAEQLLTKFELQLIAFGEPPVGFEEAVSFIQSIVNKHRREGRVAVFRKAKNFLTSKLQDVGYKIRK